MKTADRTPAASKDAVFEALEELDGFGRRLDVMQAVLGSAIDPVVKGSAFDLLLDDFSALQKRIEDLLEAYSEALTADSQPRRQA